jgi:hypothetical protein
MREPNLRVGSPVLGSPSRRIAGLGQLDLDHIGTELREQGRAERCRDEGPDIEYPNSLQRQNRALFWLCWHQLKSSGFPEISV